MVVFTDVAAHPGPTSLITTASLQPVKAINAIIKTNTFLILQA
jgi:hypothetical protein